MRPRISILFSLIFILLFKSFYANAQDQFTQFTYYDQLTWSKNGNQLAFRCVLLDEARPEQLRSNLLLKDLTTNQLLCLDPQPERFVISGDKKQLLFSSIYGLYLMKLDNQFQTTQIYFRNPAVNWWFHNFGFYEGRKEIYIDRNDRNYQKVIRENYRIHSPRFSDQIISWTDIDKLKRVRAKISNLPIDGTRGGDLPEIKIRNTLIKFVPQSGPGNYQLVYQNISQRSEPVVLIESCRPRLLSVNPAQQDIIISVFQGKEHRTYRLNFASKKLIPIENKRYFSVSWLDKSRYICITDDGLFLRNLDLTIDKKLNNWSYPKWCNQIDLSFPKFELQVGFEPNKRAAEQLAARMKYYKDQSREGYRIRVGGFKTRTQAQERGEELKKKGFDYWIDQIADLYDYFNSNRLEEKSQYGDKFVNIQYKFENYLRSRIVLIDEKKKKHVIVDEMNNFLNRSSW